MTYIDGKVEDQAERLPHERCCDDFGTELIGVASWAWRSVKVQVGTICDTLVLSYDCGNQSSHGIGKAQDCQSVAQIGGDDNSFDAFLKGDAVVFNNQSGNHLFVIQPTK